jgi:hypothetical protein
MSSSDKTKELLEQVLSQLYAEQAQGKKASNGSYLIAQDNQFLGRIIDNVYDNESILNEYGPYGSQYSNTSIFNQYSPYGSEYGMYSINNPYCTTPPQLFINGKFRGHISVNQFVPNRIPTEAFLYTLRNNLQALLSGNIIESESHARQLNYESYIVAGDGTFLGKLNPNRFDTESIFNRFGPYGNKFSQLSIFNKFSPYGGNQFSPLSPYNSFSTNPPKLYVRGKFIAYLTTNQSLNPRLHPDKLLEWAEANVSKFR